MTDFLGQRDSTDITNPFQTFSNVIWPRTVRDCMIWAKWLYNRNDMYRKAIQNVVRYFINGLSISQKAGISSVSADKVKQGEFLFNDKYRVLDVVRRAGEEQAAIGIVFISVIRRFKRILICPKCGRRYVLEEMKYRTDWNFENFEFVGKCPNPSCPSHGKKVVYKREDSDDVGHDKLYFKIWSQDDIRIEYNQITGRCKYYYSIPAREAEAIRRGEPIYIEDTPWEFIQAVKEHGDILLDPRKLLVLKNDTLATLDKLYRGWSVPLFLPSFPKILQIQMLERFNEAVMMDYITPIRLISPPAGALNAGSDPQRTPINGAMFRNQILAMINGSRGNPTQWVVSPIPAQYQLIGGEAKNLAPVDLLEWEISQLLSGMNIPMEFRQTSFQMAGPTLGLRMFERVWIHFADNLDRCAQWCADQICIIEQKDPFIVRVNKTSFVEDEQTKMNRLNLAAQGAISKTTGLKAVGLDYEQELKSKAIEEQQLQELQRTQALRSGSEESVLQAMQVPPPGLMQAMQNQEMAQGGVGAPVPPAAPGAPAMPMGMGAPDKGRMQDLATQAEEIASQIWNSPERSRVIRQLGAENPELHDLVVGILQRQDQQAMSQGLMAAKQQGQ